MYGEDTVAQRLLQVVRVIVTHEIDIVTESDWFEEYVETMVDKRIKEMTVRGTDQAEVTHAEV
jgi:hypothetical protein|tara:strand:- start:2368 stop:2556 length:189 start_codon:yes stop_codon:yes gene_type:complete